MPLPSFYVEGGTPHKSDTQTILLQKILGRINTILTLFPPVSAVLPSFFGEGSTNKKSDTQTRILQKINGALSNLETAVISTGTGAGGVTGLYNVTLVSVLRTVATATGNRGALVQSNAVVGDGMGGLYFWATGNTDTDDGIQTVRPNDYTTGGTWKKLI